MLYLGCLLAVSQQSLSSLSDVFQLSLSGLSAVSQLSLSCLSAVFQEKILLPPKTFPMCSVSCMVDGQLKIATSGGFYPESWGKTAEMASIITTSFELGKPCKQATYIS